jgi:hypothetical protein
VERKKARRRKAQRRKKDKRQVIQDFAVTTIFTKQKVLPGRQNLLFFCDITSQPGTSIYMLLKD